MMMVIKKWMLLVILLLIMSLTVPDMDAHERKISFLTDRGEILAGSVDGSFTYSDYRFFSVAGVDDEMTSIGLLGMVFILD